MKSVIAVLSYYGWLSQKYKGLRNTTVVSSKKNIEGIVIFPDHRF